MKISIIGSGVVGKATGIGFQKYGNDVIFHDIDNEKLVELRENGFEVTEDLEEAVFNSNISFVCVQTSTINGKFDLRHLKIAIMDLGRVLTRKDDYHVIVVRSTILPSYSRVKILPILERHPPLKEKVGFGFCVNPAFLRHRSALKDFVHPSRIVIGELDVRSGDIVEKLYAPFGAPIFRVDMDTAEMIKYVSNCFLATKISLFNEVYIICKKLSLNPHNVSRIVALDPRIGDYGVYGGRRFGGACFPKDLDAFLNFVESMGLNPKLLVSTIKVNKEIERKIHGLDSRET